MPKTITNQPAAQRDRLLSRARAAALLGITTRTLYSLVERKQLTPIIAPVGVGRGGKRVFFRREEVERLKSEMSEFQSATGATEQE